ITYVYINNYHAYVLVFTLNSHHPSHFFFIATAPADIYTLSLHDALPILALNDTAREGLLLYAAAYSLATIGVFGVLAKIAEDPRSEEHTSELQSRENLVCRLLLEKKKKKHIYNTSDYKLVILN